MYGIVGFRLFNTSFLFGRIQMRIILDTDKGRIIVPKNYFTQIDKMNKVLEDAKVETKIDPVNYVKDQFNLAIAKPLLRPEDKVVK